MTPEEIELLEKKNRLERLLGELVFGAIEVRERGSKRHIYVHYRLSGRQVTSYVGEYSDELFNLITVNNKKSRKLKQELKEVKHRLNALGYVERPLPEKIKRNLDFAKRNLALTIHSQAILEGVATTFASTEEVIAGAKVSGMAPEDVAKILNMKHAWGFILDPDVIQSPENLGLLMQINRLVEEGFYYNAGKIRDVPVKIGGTAWTPELPVPSKIEEDLAAILSSKESYINKAVNLILYIQKSQIFLDGNKRTAIIFANHLLISRGLGLIYIPEEETELYKQLLVAYYEGAPGNDLAAFLRTKCLLKI